MQHTGKDNVGAGIAIGIAHNGSFYGKIRVAFNHYLTN